MTPLKTIANKIERDKHHAEGAKRIGENLARFKPKVVRDGCKGTITKSLFYKRFQSFGRQKNRQMGTFFLRGLFPPC